MLGLAKFSSENTKAIYKNELAREVIYNKVLQEMSRQLCFTNFNPVLSLCSQCKSLVDCVTDTYVTLEDQCCCVTLVAVENMLIGRSEIQQRTGASFKS